MMENSTAVKSQEYMSVRFIYKKQLNIIFSATIAVLGICSFFISVIKDMNWDFLANFRYMTIVGTLFTSLVSLLTVVISVIELITMNDIKSRGLYFLKLTSVVTESIISIIILMSLFPFIPDSPNILRFDSFNMHIVIPMLTILSFLITEPPIVKIKPIMRFNGAWLITIYAVVIISMIVLGMIPQDKIPYSFLEVNTRPFWYVLLAGLIIYSCAYFLSWGYIEWNKKISEYWYR